MKTLPNSTPHQQPQASERKTRNPQKKGIVRRILRVLACFFILIGLLVATGLIILRSSWAEKYLTAEIPALLNPILAEKGLSLELDQFTGPLPGRVALSGLRLSDGHGLFLEIDRVETKLALGELLRGSLTVELAQVARPALYRLPEVLPAPHETPGEMPEETPGPGIGLDLPLDIRLDKISVEQAVVPWALLGYAPEQGMMHKENNTQLPAPDTAQAKTLHETSAEKSAAAQKDAFQLAQENNAEESPSLSNLSEVARETGLAPLNASKDQDKPRRLREAWQQTLTTALCLDIDATARLSRGILDASLNLRARDGGILPHTANREISFSRTDEDHRTTSGSQTTLSTAAVPDTLSMTNTLAQSVQSSPAETSASASSGISASASSGTNSDTSLNNSTEIRSSNTSGTSLAPSTAATSLGHNFDMQVELKPIHLVLVEPQFNTADITGGIRLQLGGFSHDIALGVLAEITEQAASLAEFSLEGLGLSLESSARILLETGRPVARLGLSGKDTKDLQLLLAAMAGQDPALLGAVLAPLSLEIDVTHHEDDLFVDLRALRAGIISAQGQTTLTNLLRTETTANPDESTNAASTSPSVKPDIRTGAESLSPKGLDAALSVQVDDLAALSPQVGGKVRADIKAHGSLNDLHTELVVNSPNLATSSGDLSDFTARLVATITDAVNGARSLGGTLKASATPNDLGPTDVSLAWNVFVPATDADGAYTDTLRANIEELRVAIFGLDIDGSLQASASPEFLQGDIQAEADTSALPALSSAGATKSEAAAHPENPNKSSGLSESSESSESSKSNVSNGRNEPGSLQKPSSLWPAGLALNGLLQATVTDWEPLSLFAQTPLQGNNTSLSIGLENTSKGQSFQVDAKSDAFSAPRHGAVLNGLNLSVEAFLPAPPIAPVSPATRDNLPLVNLHLATGKGEAANIPWNAITAVIDGDSGAGTFSFLIEEDYQKIQHKKATAAQNGNSSATSSSAARVRNPHFTTALLNNQLLSLKGQYNLRDMAFSLETLALKEPFSQTEIQLRNPTAISLKDGLALDELTLDVSSGGSLSAQATKTSTALQAKAAIADLPLTFINDMAGTTLPPGHIDADVSLQSGQQAPQGGILLELFLDSAATSRTMTAHTKEPKAGQTNAQLTGQERNNTLATQPPYSVPEQTDPVRTSQVQAGTTHNTPADIRLEAAFIQSGGRSYLSGGLDFSQLAKGGDARSAPGALLVHNPAQPNQPAQPTQLVQPVQLAQLDQVSGTRTSYQDQRASANAPLTFRVPLTVTDGIPLPDMQGPFQANLRWSGALDGFWQLVPLPDTEFSALAQMDLGLSGTLAAPRTGGTAYIAQGHFYDKAAGLLLTDIALEAHASSNDEYRLILAAEDGNKGNLGLEGALRLKDTPSINLRGQLQHLAPLHRDDLKITLTGLFGVNGPLDSPKVTADILVERGEIALVAAMGNGSVKTLPITDPDAENKESLGPGGTLDVKVTIPRRFYIRGLGLDSEWAGTLNVNGYFSEPQLVGSLRPIRGYFELISKPFAFTGGEIVFAGGSRINPGLNLELTYSAPTLEAIIRARGSLENPKLVLESNPPLPNDEVLAHVLFGKRLSELSRFEALQLANSMSELAGISSGNLNPLTTMRKATGLDVLRFGSDGSNSNQRQDSGMTGASNLGTPSQQNDSPTDSAPTLEAGKYINDSIYIGVEQGITQESTGVRVEIELFPNTTLQGKTTSSSSSAGIGWKMDY